MTFEPPSRPFLIFYFADPPFHTLQNFILRDESPYYIKENIFDNIQFYPEYFSLLSERDGYSHLYWYSMGGESD